MSFPLISYFGLFGLLMIFTTLAMMHPDLVRVCPQQLYLFDQPGEVGPQPFQSWWHLLNVVFFVYGPNRPTGKLMFHIIGAMAEFERDVRSRADPGRFRCSTRQARRQTKGDPETRTTKPGTRQRTLCGQEQHDCRNHADDRFQKQKYLL